MNARYYISALLALLSFGNLIKGQNAKTVQDSAVISGTIYDANLAQPIPYANVMVETGNVQINASYSGIDGRFTVKIPAKYKSESLQICCVYQGYKDLTYTIDSKEMSDIIELKMIPYANQTIIDYVIVCPPSPVLKVASH